MTIQAVITLNYYIIHPVKTLVLFAFCLLICVSVLRYSLTARKDVKIHITYHLFFIKYTFVFHLMLEQSLAIPALSTSRLPQLNGAIQMCSQSSYMLNMLTINQKS